MNLPVPLHIHFIQFWRLYLLGYVCAKIDEPCPDPVALLVYLKEWKDRKAS